MKKPGLVIFIMIIAILILVLIYNRGQKDENKIKAKDLVEQVVGPPVSQPRPIGSSTFIISSPYALIASNNPIPEEYMSVIEKVEVFKFEKNPFFDGGVSYTRYINANYDLEGGVNGSIANVKKLPGIEKIEEKNRQYFENSKYQWYVFEELMYRNSETGTYKGAIVKSVQDGQDTWLVFLTVLDTDKGYIVDNILNSISKNE